MEKGIKVPMESSYGGTLKKAKKGFIKLQSATSKNVNHIFISEDEEDVDSEDDVMTTQLSPPPYEEIQEQPAPPRFEDGTEATVDELIELNLGTPERPKPVFLSASLSQKEMEEYHWLLLKFRNVFGWSYKDMPGLSSDIAVHKLSVSCGLKPVKQGQQRMRPELRIKVEEVRKMVSAGFIQEV